MRTHACLVVAIVLTTSTPSLLAAPGALPLTSRAESEANVVTGLVVDTTGGAVPGAVVILHHGDIDRQAVTDGTGRFAFPDAPTGRVTLTITLDQFAPVTLDLDTLRHDLRITLEPQRVAEQVIVRATAPQAERHASALKTLTPLRDVPQAITVVTQAAIAEQAMSGLGDVVRYVPGIGAGQGEGNRDQLYFRGNSSTSDFYVDGVRDDVQYFRDLYNVERVEALKGPNAMLFGRGGVGGVINRVTRQADWTRVREATLQAGSFDARRATIDLGEGLADATALRLTGVYEDSSSYRAGVGTTRYGLNPTAAFALPGHTVVKLGYEFFHDERTADRGVPSSSGRPFDTNRSTFFGDPRTSTSEASVHAVGALVERTFDNAVVVRNRTRFADYEKFYQNVYPGAVSAAAATVAISAYNNRTSRQNLFNQTDVLLAWHLGRVRHNLVAGAEFGRQDTGNFRETGYFTGVGPNATSFSAPLTAPTISVPVTYRQSPTDADNDGVATMAAAYAQDEVVLTPRVQAIVGLRYDRFAVRFRNNRTSSAIDSADGLWSPRVGIVVKPVAPVSLYASYTLAHQPRAGEQLSSLTLTTRALAPEEFRNYEVGAKWEVRPMLTVTSAVYRLNRTNVFVPDPVDPSRSQLVDGQRTEGVEMGVDGNLAARWAVLGAYAWQRGEITRTLSATAKAGARLAQVPTHTFSLWNKYTLARAWGVGLGIIRRSDMFTSTDNTVALPAFTRVDGAVFLGVSRALRAQLNVENLFDAYYYSSANNNNNITPGSPRAIRLTLTTRF